MELTARLNRIKKILEDNKGENIEIFNLENSDYMVSGVVIATAMADKHLLALLNFIRVELKNDEQFLNSEISDEWIVIDLTDILVHVMTKHARDKYHLESFLNEFAKKRSL